MAFRDMREYIGMLEEEGEVQRIEAEVDPDLEVGAVVRHSYDLRAPAPFFQKLKGYPAGFHIFGAPMGLSRKPGRTFVRVATSLGLPPQAGYAELTDLIAARLRAVKPNSIQPMVSRDAAPCKENILLGDDVNLDLFPAPLIHGGDAGRYIGTWHTVITKDPDTDCVNWGMYRLMKLDRSRFTAEVLPQKDIGIHFYRKYEPRGKPMPFAVAIGTEPVAAMVSALRLAKQGEPDADYVCALRGLPLEMVPCETVDLMVPAGSEIILEGEVMPGEREMEGPFGEFTGYQVGERSPQPVFHVKAITYRNNPILPVSCMGAPVDDSAAFSALFKAAIVKDFLLGQGFPITQVFCPPECCGFLLAISTRVPYAGYTKLLANAVYGQRVAANSYYLAIFNEDVDVTNQNELMHAMFTRCHPYRGIFKNDKTPGSPLVPFSSIDERRNGTAAQAWLDCTWPQDWDPGNVPIKASFDVLWPKEAQEKVLSRWGEYGYQD